MKTRKTIRAVNTIISILFVIPLYMFVIINIDLSLFTNIFVSPEPSVWKIVDILISYGVTTYLFYKLGNFTIHILECIDFLQKHIAILAVKREFNKLCKIERSLINAGIAVKDFKKKNTVVRYLHNQRRNLFIVEDIKELSILYYNKRNANEVLYILKDSKSGEIYVYACLDDILLAHEPLIDIEDGEIEITVKGKIGLTFYDKARQKREKKESSPYLPQKNTISTRTKTYVKHLNELIFWSLIIISFIALSGKYLTGTVVIICIIGVVLFILKKYKNFYFVKRKLKKMQKVGVLDKNINLNELKIENTIILADGPEEKQLLTNGNPKNLELVFQNKENYHTNFLGDMLVLFKEKEIGDLYAIYLPYTNFYGVEKWNEESGKFNFRIIFNNHDEVISFT